MPTDIKQMSDEELLKIAGVKKDVSTMSDEELLRIAVPPKDTPTLPPLEQPTELPELEAQPDATRVQAEQFAQPEIKDTGGISEDIKEFFNIGNYGDTKAIEEFVGMLFSPTAEISRGTQNFIGDLQKAGDRFTGVPRSPFDTTPISKDQEFYESLNPIQQRGSDVLRLIGDYSTGLAGFLAGLPAMILEPSKGLQESPKKGETAFVARTKQEVTGLMTMFTDLLAQGEYLVAHKFLGFELPDEISEEYKESINRLYESPAAPVFAFQILHGTGKLTGKTIAK